MSSSSENTQTETQETQFQKCGQSAVSTVFDMDHAIASMRDCIQNPDSMPLSAYLDAFREFIKYLSSLGSLFSFVTRDVKVLIRLLERLMSEDSDSRHYQTLQSMIVHERSSGLLQERPTKSGCRAVLGLNRGLEFLAVFLDNLARLPDEASATKCARAAYNETLAKHDAKLMRKMVKAAFVAFPNRRVMMRQFFGGKSDPNPSQVTETVEKMHELARIGGQVYHEVRRVLGEYHLLDLA